MNVTSSAAITGARTVGGRGPGIAAPATQAHRRLRIRRTHLPKHCSASSRVNKITANLP